jgi:hypothetical protein
VRAIQNTSGQRIQAKSQCDEAPQTPDLGPLSFDGTLGGTGAS